MAAELGLDAVDGVSYTRTFCIFNQSDQSLSINGTGWTINFNRTLVGYDCFSYMYNIFYSAEDGWEITCIPCGLINLD
jgi:hypothetical protein